MILQNATQELPDISSALSGTFLSICAPALIDGI
jgi:hypothetical protein